MEQYMINVLPPLNDCIPSSFIFSPSVVKRGTLLLVCRVGFSQLDCIANSCWPVYSSWQWCGNLTFPSACMLVLLSSYCCCFQVRSTENHSHYLINPFGLLYHEIQASSFVKIDDEGLWNIHLCMPQRALYFTMHLSFVYFVFSGAIRVVRVF